jgi:hypothetical protein
MVETGQPFPNGRAPLASAHDAPGFFFATGVGIRFESVRTDGTDNTAESKGHVMFFTEHGEHLELYRSNGLHYEAPASSPSKRMVTVVGSSSAVGTLSSTSCSGSTFRQVPGSKTATEGSVPTTDPERTAGAW